MHFERHLARLLERNPDWERGLDCLSLPADKKELERIIGPIRSPQSAPLSRILDFAHEQLGCDRIVVENEYTSTDFHDEYAASYSRAFQNYPRVCKRIHFLATNGAGIDLHDILNATDRLLAAYRGYTVLRPLPTCRVGDTMLPCPFNTSEAEFVHCVVNSEAHLLGYRLPPVRAMPFIQQETRVTICAEAALWMVLRYLHSKGECKRFRPSEITRRVIDPLYTSFVRDGLYVEQIGAILQDMGLERVVEFPRDARAAHEQLYAYTESELPVIVGIPKHVVTVIGHDYDINAEQPFLNTRRNLASNVTAFYVHDDSKGPYLRQSISHTTLGGHEYLTLDDELVLSFVAPLPSRVNLSARHAAEISEEVLQGVSEFVRSVFGDIFSDAELWTAEECSELVKRCYLRRSDVFKRDLVERTLTMDQQFIVRYWRQPMPRYVWIVELSDPAELDEFDPVSRRIRGEIVLDSTAIQSDPYSALLSFHLNGRMLIRQGAEPLGTDDDAPFATFIDRRPHERPYAPLLRKAVT